MNGDRLYQPHQEEQTRVEKIAENAWLKLATRLGAPILVALSLWIFNTIKADVDDLKSKSFESTRAQWQIFGKVEELKNVTEQKLENLGTKIKNNETNINRHENSINNLWQRKQDREFR